MKGLLRKTAAIVCGVATLFVGCACGKEKKTSEDVYYKVSFEENGGTETDDVWVRAGEPFKAADRYSTREGYAFDGWFLDPTFCQAADGTVPTADLTLYAKWLGKYALRFQGEGVELADKWITEGEPIQAPPDPKRENYKFEGWYADEACETAFTFGVMPAAHTTLYAKWRELITVYCRFYLNVPHVDEYNQLTKCREASLLELSGLENDFVRDAQRMVAALCLKGEKDVYRFVGWATDEAGETPFDGVVPYSLTEVKIYAIWERTEDYCQIVFTSKDDPSVQVTKYLPIGETLDGDMLSEIEREIGAETENGGFYTDDGVRYDGAPITEDIRLTLQ